jgi:hypothetical protein
VDAPSQAVRASRPQGEDETDDRPHVPVLALKLDGRPQLDVEVLLERRDVVVGVFEIE